MIVGVVLFLFSKLMDCRPQTLTSAGSERIKSTSAGTVDGSATMEARYLRKGRKLIQGQHWTCTFTAQGSPNIVRSKILEKNGELPACADDRTYGIKTCAGDALKTILSLSLIHI